MLPRNDANPCKYIYVIRNPKDVCVSYYHHMRSIKHFELKLKSFGEFYHLFMNGPLLCGSYIDHIKPWWQHRTDSNILFLTYEDMKRDLPSAVLSIAKFIGVTDLTDAEVALIASKTSFEAMRDDDKANYKWSEDRRKEDGTPFMRKGEVGDWATHFTEEQSARLEEVYEKELGSLGLHFDYTI